MPDKRSKFHEFALRSILFKGREDWYFCYLKAERIAHVMSVLERAAPAGYETHVREIATRAAALPGDIAHLAAGEIDAPVVLADIFSLLSGVRLAGTEKALHKDTAAILEAEYEQVAERLVAGSHPSPFVTAEDFGIPHISLAAEDRPLLDTPVSYNVFNKGQQKDTQKSHIKPASQGHSDRAARILEFIRTQAGQTGQGATIKEIAAVIRGVSEKTMREDHTKRAGVPY
jgi:hypothetical protein